jgi:hypothetical protein
MSKKNKLQREIGGEEANLFCKVGSMIRRVEDLIVEH